MEKRCKICVRNYFPLGNSVNDIFIDFYLKFADVLFYAGDFCA